MIFPIITLGGSGRAYERYQSAMALRRHRQAGNQFSPSFAARMMSVILMAVSICRWGVS